LRPEIDEVGERAIEQQRGGVGIGGERLRRGDEAGDDARPLIARCAFVASGMPHTMCTDASRMPCGLALMLARSEWMRHGMVGLSVEKKQSMGCDARR
jgi:hypothetical protein